MRRELLLIGEMIEAAEQAQALVAGTDVAALSADRQRRDALLWNYTVLGEAAAQLDEEVKARFPSIEWLRPAQLRNRIIHGYWSIDLQILHTTATDQLPGFVEQLRGALTQLEGDEANVVLAVEDPRADDVRALLSRHLEFARAVTAPDHVHALDLDGALDSAVTFFGARRGGVLLAVGALKRLNVFHAEVKSMHVSEAARGQGVGRAMIDYLLDVAAQQGYRRVSLETGTMEAFAPARSLYERVGFERCEPFGEYVTNENSICMTIVLSGTPT